MRTGAVIVCVVLLAGCDSETIIRGTTALADTHDRIGPYAVVSEVYDPDGVGSVSLRYRAGSTDEIELSMEQLRGEVYEASIPGQPPFTTIHYYVIATDAGSEVTDPPGALLSELNQFTFRVLSSKCTDILECGPGEFCDTSGLCRQHLGPCTKDVECGKGMRCGPDGACRLAARSCVLDETCLVGEVCDAILDQCAPRPVCDGTLGCPLDFECDTKLGVCRRSCFGTADCGPGETCVAHVCSGAKSCTTQPECGAVLVCDTLGGYCRPEGAAPCAPCVGDADCGGPTDFCLLLTQGQYCGQDCSSNPCPSGYSCSKNTVPAQCVPTSGICP